MSFERTQMPNLSGLKILVVEDNEDLVRLHVRWMEKEGITVFYSLNGKDGIELLREHPDIDMVLLDMNLPDISGDEVFTGLRQLNPQLPVIFYSGYSNRLEAIRPEPNIRLLSKPFFLPSLKEMVGELTGRK